MGVNKYHKFMLKCWGTLSKVGQWLLNRSYFFNIMDQKILRKKRNNNKTQRWMCRNDGYKVNTIYFNKGFKMTMITSTASSASFSQHEFMKESVWRILVLHNLSQLSPTSILHSLSCSTTRSLFLDFPGTHTSISVFPSPRNNQPHHPLHIPALFDWGFLLSFLLCVLLALYVTLF